MNRSGQLLATNDPVIYDLLKDENYKVTPDGKVLTRVAETGKVFVDESAWRESGHLNQDGYVEIKYQGSQIRRCRIVFAAFKGQLHIDLIVNHIDAVRNNDHPDNLELITQSANNIHRFKSKPAVIGNSVLNWEIVTAIRQEKAAGHTHKYLALKYGISKGHISEIVNNKIWVPGKPYTGKHKTLEIQDGIHISASDSVSN